MSYITKLSQSGESALAIQWPGIPLRLFLHPVRPRPPPTQPYRSAGPIGRGGFTVVVPCTSRGCVRGFSQAGGAVTKHVTKRRSFVKREVLCIPLFEKGDQPLFERGGPRFPRGTPSSRAASKGRWPGHTLPHIKPTHHGRGTGRRGECTVLPRLTGRSVHRGGWVLDPGLWCGGGQLGLAARDPSSKLPGPVSEWDVIPIYPHSIHGICRGHSVGEILLES